MSAILTKKLRDEVQQLQRDLALLANGVAIALKHLELDSLAEQAHEIEEANDRRAES